MGSQMNFPLKGLDGEEARDLFIQNAGKCNGNLQETARKIVRECDGLPIAIVTVARALKDKPSSVWDDSLRKLQKSNLLAISGMDKVYSRIQLSYDLLNDKETQSCFLFCCLFPEDYDVPVEKVVFYGKGLELFEGVDSLKEARDRVDSIIDKLKKSFLLLDGKGDEYVRLHDIVRDFAISICSKDEYPYLVRCEKEMKKWPETSQLEECSAISIVCNYYSSKVGIPADLICPNLKLLQIYFEYSSGELSICFFKGMGELRVVDLRVKAPLPPLTKQKKIRTLLIHYEHEYDRKKRVEPIYFRKMLTSMKNLEILSLSFTTFSDFPVEIGQLCNLRCLRFHYSVSFDYMPPGVLSNLVKLEELTLASYFQKWGLKEEGGNRVNASLSEIESFPLTSISIGVPKGSLLVEKIVESITKFQIVYGRYYQFFNSDSNVLNIGEVDECDASANWIGSLLRKCDNLILWRVRELKYIMFQQLRGNIGFPLTYFSRLKTLTIMYMDSLEEIWDGLYMPNIQTPCFPNLTDIEIWCCPKLKHVFPLSVATELRQLQHMRIRYCDEMENIFWKDQVDDGNQVLEESSERESDRVTVLPRLKRMRLEELPKLRILHNGRNHAIECPSLEYLKIEKCNNMEALCYGSFNVLGTMELELTEVRYLKNIMKWLHLEKHNGIPHLTKLSLSKCHEMKYLVDVIADPIQAKALFSPLKELSIMSMDGLEEIWHGPYLSNTQPACFLNLTKIMIIECPNSTRVFPLSVATELRQLQDMNISFCDEMVEIFYKDQIVEGSIAKVDEREVDRVIVLPQLTRLILRKMPKLRIMYNGNHAIECPLLEYIGIEECNNLEALSYGSLNAPTTKQLVLSGVRYLKKNIIKWLNLEKHNVIPKLTKLDIENSFEMKYLVDAMTDMNLLKAFFSGLEELTMSQMDYLEEICNGTCFPNLTRIEIWDCPKLKHVLSLPVATQLSQLQHMEISHCAEVEEIFYKDQIVRESMEKFDESEVNNAISFPRLKLLSLRYMPKLIMLYKGKNSIEFPSLEELKIEECNNMEALLYGSFNAPIIKKLTFTGARYVKNVIKWLHLEQDMDLLKALLFPLEVLSIEDMYSLEEIWNGPYYLSNIQLPCYFRNLSSIEIRKCPKLKYVFPISMATQLKQLQQLRIWSCDEIEEIFFKDQILEEPREKEVDHATTDIVITFPKLRVLRLLCMSKLKIVYDGNHALEFPSLQELQIIWCSKIEALSKGSFKAPKLKDMKINWNEYPLTSGKDLNTIVTKRLNITEDKNKVGDKDKHEAEDKDKDHECRAEDKEDKGINHIAN